MTKKIVSGPSGSDVVNAEMAEAMAEASRTDAEVAAEAAAEADKIAELALAAEALAAEAAKVEAAAAEAETARLAARTPVQVLDESVSALKVKLAVATDEPVKTALTGEIEKLLKGRPIAVHDSNVVLAKRKLDAAKADKASAEEADDEEQQIVALRVQASAKLELSQAVSDRGAFIAAPDLLAMLIAAGYVVECRSRIEIALVFEGGKPTGARAITMATSGERKLTAVDGALKTAAPVSSNFTAAPTANAARSGGTNGDVRLPPSGWSYKATMKPIDGWTFTWLGADRCVAQKGGVTFGPMSQNKVCSSINGGKDIASYNFLGLGSPGAVWNAEAALKAGFIAPK